MSPSGDARARRRIPICLALAAALTSSAAAGADEGQPDFWLGFGRNAALCAGRGEPSPVKIAGASWGVLASGAARCQDEGDAYVVTVDYLNVSMDPSDGGATRETGELHFDWLGLSLYRPAERGRKVDWLFDDARPVKATLRQDDPDRVVLGKIAFRVPKQRADRASNLLFYLTFNNLVVAVHVL